MLVLHFPIARRKGKVAAKAAPPLRATARIAAEAAYGAAGGMPQGRGFIEGGKT
jgi:hypothetical protein